jgi:hypothetical protein
MLSGMSNVTPGQHLTRLPGPRVLIQKVDSEYRVSGRTMQRQGVYDATDLAQRLRASVPTVAIATSLSDFNLDEWDCLVTTTPPVEYFERQEPQSRSQQPRTLISWSQRYPEHLSVVCLVRAGDSLQVIDAHPPAGDQEEDPPDIVVVRDPNKVGLHLRQVDGLPERLANVVSRDLVPVARARSTHPSFRRWPDAEEEPSASLLLTPFLLGPNDVVLAGRYPKSDGATVWLLPDDVPDPFPWIVEALREWHNIHPERFPLVPDWHGDDDWRSYAEAEIERKRVEVGERLAVLIAECDAEVAALEPEADAARARADGYHRALLTEDGDSLAEAVACALADLGFHVVDMDQHWPTGDRREDLRVFDDEDAEWVAIVEVKGARNGPKETEVHNFGRWAERFALEERRLPDARWFVTNHQRALDPGARQAPFHNKQAVLTTFAASGGSVMDTRGLFDLLRLVEGNADLAVHARVLLKSHPQSLVRVTLDDLNISEGEGKASDGR